MKHSRLLQPIVMLLSLSLLGACSGPDEDGATKGASSKPADPWSEYVSSHTRHEVSRREKIRIRFVHPVIDDTRVGESAGDFLTIEPAVTGSVTFSNSREILLIPDEPLKSGTEFLVTVKREGLKGIPATLDDYHFKFRVKKQDLQVAIRGLKADPSDKNIYQFSAELITADEELPELITQTITVRVNGKEVAPTWVHNEDGRHHLFSLNDIPRGTEEGSLVVAWNGSPIKVENSGEQRIEIPAQGVFNVTGVRVVQGEQRYISVNFSDTLNKGQNLNGMVRLSDTDFTTAIDGSTLKVYPQSEVSGELQLTIEPGIKGSGGGKLVTAYTQNVVFAAQKPGVRFAGQGVILPANEKLTVPVEAINVHSFQVTAFEVFEDNLGQFLQSNKLDGEEELYRVGRYLWRKTIHMESSESNKWNRYALDVSELMAKHPGSLFRLTLSIDRGNSLYACSEEESAVPLPKARELQNRDDISRYDDSSWDYADEYYNPGGYKWSDRQNPCKDAYFAHDSNARAERNFLASNIGLLAKRGEAGEMLVVATDLREAQPLSGVSLRVMNFQDRMMAEATTDGEGFSRIRLDDTPFYLIAEKDGERGYLKLNKGSALPTSHFDVGGQRVTKGLKGHIYGERGVWRPGDKLHLTFVLQDRQNTIPDNHPVTMELYNPKGVLVQSVTNSEPVGDFYAFTLRTDEEAPTGNWQVKATLGGSVFSRSVKIETVVPNRLKMALDFGDEVLYHTGQAQSGKLTSQWLHGAKASGLKADVALRLNARPTKFERFTDLIFDDPARQFSGERQMLFEGKLDGDGVAAFSSRIQVDRNIAPGMLRATFFSRVFEQGGAFSSASQGMDYHPFERYVGIKTPRGDEMRGMLLTDVDHEVNIGTLSAKGEPVAVGKIEMSLYKVDWKWWWDKSGDSLARYAQSSHHNRIAHGTVETGEDGMGSWSFQVKYPAWGRYLLRACDTDGGHCTGKLFYIDWPGWAGRAQEEGSSGANVLNFFADKSTYEVGEEAIVTLPEGAKGRALLTVESGSAIIEQRWLQLSAGEAGKAPQVRLPITEAMAPNVYVSVTLLQPHREKQNDRPIRLYGVTAIKVNDPATRLTPLIEAEEEIRPNATTTVKVSEQNGRAMTYTLALVDEGLLGLTNFKTPNLHKQFYRKEALGVTTWDLFDYVAGAYGGELETLLALGGSDDADDEEGAKKRRFPPVVRFLGPFQLEAGESASHEVDVPHYVGALRTMVVAGEQGAYGLAEKEVIVREPLSMLSTLPRVLRAGEELQVPVSLFAYHPDIREVELAIKADDHFEVVGEPTVRVAFDGPGEKLGFLRLKVKQKLGKGHVQFVAKAGKFESSSEVYIDILSANPVTTRYQREVIEPGDEWETTIKPHGIEGTNRSVLEISTAPPLDLDRRLRYLIRYPHGCVEQTTSAVFPQLSLPTLVKLDKAQRDELDHNIERGIEKLRGFQTSEGGFSYWAGSSAGADDWGSTYAGNFLLEAKKAGYLVPPEMLADWVGYQQRNAQSWVTGGNRSMLGQSYRLYTLALAGKPEMGAMNRMREQSNLDSVSARMLASAYQLSGLSGAATDLIDSPLSLFDYEVEGSTYGSRLRDRAIALDALTLAGEGVKAKALADEIAKDLSSEKWHSTQSLAFSLNAMARFVGNDEQKSYRFSYQVGEGSEVEGENDSAYYSQDLQGIAIEGSEFKVENRSERVLYAAIVSEGAAPAGEEQESMNELTLRVSYSDPKGNRLDISRLTQGTDLKATIKVTNNTRRKLENLALSHIVPAGWEIHNARLTGDGEAASGIDHQDIRDDRIYTYFSLEEGKSKEFSVLLNAAYLGRFYQPAIGVEAMYDATRHARVKGEWVEVVKE
ncbi:MAG: MG2 domain-containing protein [Chromatiales bacterium]|nr:MG2 domain-containing protein [Chromatiales bacterium]